MTSPAALHSVESDEHFTPLEIAVATHEVMGAIDLDPFSCATANASIGAGLFFTPEDDGYAQDWGGSSDPQRLFINPPSSRVKRKPARAPKALVKPGAIHAWWKLIDEVSERRVSAAVFLSFNMNLFQTAQRFGYPAPYRFPFCVPDKRLKFWGEGRKPGEGAPSHASALVYIGPDPGAFVREFSCFGEVRL